MTARKISLVILSCLAACLLSCDIDVPIQEMVNARTTIEKARAVMAEQYDPENLGKAEEWLKKSHDYLVEKDVKNAKGAAEKSSVYGDMALQASLPKATDAAIADARAVVEEADKLNAGEYAPEAFTQAAGALVEAEKLKNDNNLWDAYVKAKEAVAAGNEAREISQGKIPGLNEELGRLKKEVDDLNSLKLTDQQKKAVAAAGAELDRAGGLIVENNVKAALPLMAEAEKTITTVKADAGKASARARIAQLRKEVEQLKKTRGSEFAGEDLDVVVTTLNEADALLEQDRIDDANKKIADAESSLAIVKEKNARALALDKAKSVEKLLEETRSKDTEGTYKAETDRAAGIIADGKKLLEGGSYKESLVKFEEAEALLYSLGVAKEKGDLSKGSGLYEEEGKTIYKVVYDRKKRDCLWRIADKVYNNARLWPLIYMANKDQIKDPDLIFPGQRFVIPEIPKKQSDKKEKEDTSAIREEKTGAEGNAGGAEPEAAKDTVDEDMTE